MRLGCIALILGGGLTFLGGQKLYETLSSGKLQTVTYADFVKTKPGVGWYAISDGHWRLADAGVITGGMVLDEDLYLPVRKPGDPAGSEKIEVLLHRKNQGEAAQLAKLFALPAEKQAAEVAKDPSLEADHSVQGMVEIGMDSQGKQRDAVRGSFGDELSPDYVVITDGAEPSGYLWPLLALIAGIGILAMSLRGLARSGAEVTDD